MKLMLCTLCADVVALTPEVRYCKCGECWGKYLEDNATTIQTAGSISLALANPDLSKSVAAYNKNPDAFSPYLFMRAWINPMSESDVEFIDRGIKPEQVRIQFVDSAGVAPATDPSQEDKVELKAA